MAGMLCRGMLGFGRSWLRPASLLHNSLVTARQQDAGFSAVADDIRGPAGPGSMDIYISNIKFTVKAEDVKQLLTPFGTLERFHMPSRKSGSRINKGYAFATMPTASATQAIEKLNGLDIDGRPLAVIKQIVPPAGSHSAVKSSADSGAKPANNAAADAEPGAKVDKEEIQPAAAAAVGTASPAS